MSVKAYNEKIEQYFGDKKIVWKFCNGQKIESPKFEYPILFGIEMEYEVKTPKDHMGSKEIQQLYRAQVSDRLEPTYHSFAFAKHDGSLKNGFEVVSVPMSMDAHAEQWKPFFAIAKENGLLVHANCGMHVHVSREFLTPLQVGKIIEMVHSPKNKEFIKAIAGRNKPVYNGPDHKVYTEIGAKTITDVNHHFERYAALNLSGSQTIEFRFFKSTLDLKRMLQNLEFCDALVRFSWPSGATSIQEIKENGLRLFSKFVLENRKTYPNFFEFMSDHKYIPKPKINKKKNGNF